MIEASDCVYFLHNWTESNGAKREMEYAEKLGKEVWLDGKINAQNYVEVNQIKMF